MRHYLDTPAGWQPPDLAEIYDEASLWGARFGALLLDQLAIRPGVRGLDVGCGAGFPLIELASLHGATSHFTGLDTWAAALERARLKIDSRQLTNIELAQADAVAMPFADASFDLVVSNLGVNNFEDAPAALSECRRVARPGARLALTTNVMGHFAQAYALLDRTTGELGLSAAQAALRHDAEHRRTPDGVARLLTDAGFPVARQAQQTFQMRFADGAAMLHHPLVKWFLDGWRTAVGPADEREVFAALEARLDAVAAKASSITMTVPMLYLEGIAA